MQQRPDVTPGEAPKGCIGSGCGRPARLAGMREPWWKQRDLSDAGTAQQTVHDLRDRALRAADSAELNKLINDWANSPAPKTGALMESIRKLLLTALDS